MDIYTILSRKPHNIHYLKRYIKFINSASTNETYTEIHHICPKANDMFPEYENLSKNPWNKIRLSARQHFIAHKLLSKAYPNTSQEIVLYFMFSFSKIRNRDYEKHKIKFSEFRKGKSAYKDTFGNKYFLSTNDPLIKELNLFGCNKGIIVTEETKEKQRRCKDNIKKCLVYKFDKKIKILASQIEQYIKDGWSVDSTEYKALIKEKKRKSVSSKLKGTANYYLNGNFYAKLKTNDPIIKELGLTLRKQDKDEIGPMLIAAKERLTGTKAYNNGIIEIKLKETDNVPEGFVLGGKPRKKSK